MRERIKVRTGNGTIIRNDPGLGLEGLRFKGLLQDFPRHFHDYYVIGFIREGRRRLAAGGRERLLEAGDAVVFNPLDDHGCRRADGGPLHYLGLHISVQTMEKLTGRLFGHEFRPRLTGLSPAMGAEIASFHDSFMAQERPGALETAFLDLMRKILANAAEDHGRVDSGESGGVEAARLFMERSYAEPLCLDHLSSAAGMSKYHFLRSFSRRTGLPPHSYLLALRVAKARELLAGGCRLSEAALQTGFADQSHFTNRFKQLTGLTPSAYYLSLNKGVSREPDRSSIK